MTDDDLDRRLHEALRVVPAPDLAARVRARIANEPPLTPSWRWLPVVAGGAAIAAVVATLVSRGLTLPANDAHGLAGPDVTAVAALPATPLAVSPSIAAHAAAPVPAIGVVRSTAPPRSWPQSTRAAVSHTVTRVAVAPGDAEAYSQVHANSVGAQEPTGPSVPGIAVDTLIVGRLDVAPLTVAPLVVGDAASLGDPR